jgi:hypothetical protein
MTKFIAFTKIASIPNDAHLGFHVGHETAAKALVTLLQYDPTLAQNLATYTTTIIAERTLYDWSASADNIGAQIEAADTAMMNQYSIVSGSIRLAQRNPATEAAAGRLYKSIEMPRFQSKPRDQRIGFIQEWVVSCEQPGQNHDDAAALSLTDANTLLRNRFEALKTLIDKHNAHLATRPQGEMKTLRHTTDEAYRALNHRIEGLQEFASTDPLKAAAEQFTLSRNVQINKLNNEYNRPRRNLKGHTVSDGFPSELPYTGQPVTPVANQPVYYVETDAGGAETEKTELFFGKDYDILYRNNTNKGKAYIIVRGKSTYTGAEEFPFEII